MVKTATKKLRVKSDHSIKRSSLQRKRKWGLPMLFLVGCALVGAFTIFLSGAAPKHQTQAVTLFMEPSSQRVQVGGMVSVELRLDTNSYDINAVQANLSYPTDKLEFVNIDSSTSAFSVEAQTAGGNGSVAVARGAINPVNNSAAIVTTVNFKALAPGRKIQIQYTQDSMAVTPPDGKNVLQKTAGTQITIQ